VQLIVTNKRVENVIVEIVINKIIPICSSNNYV